MDRSAAEEPEIWLVDGFNVLHAGLLRGRDRGRWWRAEERQRVVERARRFDAGAAEVWVVFDGERPAEEHAPEDPRFHVVYAPCADAWLLSRVRAAPEPERVCVVTRDAQLADRSRHRGARVASPRDFLARCGDAAPETQD